MYMKIIGLLFHGRTSSQYLNDRRVRYIYIYIYIERERERERQRERQRQRQTDRCI